MTDAQTLLIAFVVMAIAIFTLPITGPWLLLRMRRRADERFIRDVNSGRDA